MHIKPLLSSILVAAFAASALTQDLWLENGDKGYRLVYGHPGKFESDEPGKIKSVLVVDKDGQQKIASHVHDDQLMVQASPDAAIVAISFDNGFQTETPAGEYLNKPKREVPHYISSVHSKKLKKILLAWTAASGKPVGADFEILPLSNPLTLKPGEQLTVQLIYKSQPLTGADVEILGSNDLFITDSEGKVSLPIADAGFQYIHASLKEPLKDNPDADMLALSTNLMFTL